MTSNLSTLYVSMLDAANDEQAATERTDDLHAQTCLSVREALNGKTMTAKDMAASFAKAGESVDSLPGAAAVKMANATTIGYAWTVGIALSLPVDDADESTACPVTSRAFLARVRSAVETVGKGGQAKVRTAVTSSASPAAAFEAVAKIDRAAKKVVAEQKAAAKAAAEQAKADKIAAEIDADDDAETVETVETVDAETVAETVDALDVDRLAVAVADLLNLLESNEPISETAADLLATLSGMIAAKIAA